MALRLGDHAPDFHAETTLGPLRFHRWKGTSWAMLFSHPRDFTPVCTTELGTLARLLPEFERRDVKVLGLSVDSVPDHALWAADIAETQQVDLSFPLIGDSQRHVARLYDMIHPGASETTTVRSVFVIDPGNRVRLTLAYPASTGRSFVELLRAVDALQLSARHAVATPAEWRNGDDVIILPSLTDDQARIEFPDGWRAQKPYLRFVPQPGA